MRKRVLRSRVIHQGRVFTLRADTIRLPNGAVRVIDRVVHRGAVAIVPFSADGKMILIRQFRPAIGGYLYEIPAGTLDPHESPAVCARRELREETGYHGGTFTKMTAIYPCPGYSTEKIHLYLATGLRRGTQMLEGDEVITVEECALREVALLVAQGKIIDGKTLAGLLVWKERSHHKVKNKKAR